jgi:hypothetical protein
MINNQNEATQEVIDEICRDSLKKVSGTTLTINAKVERLALELERLSNLKIESTMSPEQDQLLEALAQAKSEMATIGIERSGHITGRGSYATIDDLREFIDPIISKYGLSLRTEPVEIGNEDFLRAVLGHKSGQWSSSLSRIRVDYSKGGDALQAYGKALTSMKRYVLGAYFMVGTGGDKD